MKLLNPLDLSSNKIINLATPTASTDAATKGYADGLILPIGYPLQSGRWYSQGGIYGYATGTATLAANILYAFPLYFPKLTSIQKIGINVSTAAGTNGRLALYAADGNAAGNYPGTLIASGSISTATTGDKTVSLSLSLQGMYFGAAVFDGAPVVRVDSVTGNLPLGNSAVYNTSIYRSIAANFSFADPPSSFPAGQSIASLIGQFIYFQAT